MLNANYGFFNNWRIINTLNVLIFNGIDTISIPFFINHNINRIRNTYTIKAPQSKEVPSISQAVQESVVRKQNVRM